MWVAGWRMEILLSSPAVCFWLSRNAGRPQPGWQVASWYRLCVYFGSCLSRPSPRMRWWEVVSMKGLVTQLCPSGRAYGVSSRLHCAPVHEVTPTWWSGVCVFPSSLLSLQIQGSSAQLFFLTCFSLKLCVLLAFHPFEIGCVYTHRPSSPHQCQEFATHTAHFTFLVATSSWCLQFWTCSLCAVDHGTPHKIYTHTPHTQHNIDAHTCTLNYCDAPNMC